MIQNILKRFSRITTGAKIIPEVEGLRFIAITTVFLFHLHEEILHRNTERLIHGSFDSGLLAMLSKLGIGVQLFFAISGFILALRFAQHGINNGPAVSLKSYFLRRLTRLEPPYIIALVLTMPLAILIAGGLRQTWGLLPHFVASATYTHGLFYKSRSFINSVSWSLEVEIQFYILAPLFGLVYKLRSSWQRYLIYIIATVGALVWQSFHATDVWQLFLPSYLQYFAAGFFLADIYVARWNGRPSVHWRGDVLSVLGWVSLATLLLAQGFWLSLLPVAILIAYTGAFTGIWTKSVLSNPVITTIGGMCYTIYLYHFSIIIVISRITFRAIVGHSFLLNLLIQLILLGAITLAASFLLFALFERPFMDKEWPQKTKAYFLMHFSAPDSRNA